MSAPRDVGDATHPNCEVCGDPLARTTVVTCAGCETPHHLDCWRYAGRCAVFGCHSQVAREPGGRGGRDVLPPLADQRRPEVHPPPASARPRPTRSIVAGLLVPALGFLFLCLVAADRLPPPLDHLTWPRRQLCRIPGEGGGKGVNLALSRDGGLLALAFWGGDTVQVWETRAGRRRLVVGGHGVRFRALALSPDDRWLAAAGDDGTARIWDAATGEETARVLPVGEAARVAFSPGGGTLAVGTEAGSIHLYEVAGGRLGPAPSRTLEGHTKKVLELVFSRDGALLLSRSWDLTVRCWLLATGRGLKRRYREKPFDLVFAADGRILVREGPSNRVWDLSSDELAWEVTPPEYPDGSRRILSGDGRMTLSPRGDWLLTRGFWEGDPPALQEVATGRDLLELDRHRSPVQRAVFSEDQRVLVTAEMRGATVRVWDLSDLAGASAPPARAIENPFARSRPPAGLGWDGEAARPEAVLETRPGRTLRLASDGVRWLRFSDDRRVLGAGGPGEVALFDLRTGKVLARRGVMEFRHRIDAFALAPDGRRFAVGHGYYGVRLHEVGREGPLRTWTPRREAIATLAFSPSGSHLAIADAGGWVLVAPVAGGEPARWEVPPGEGRVEAMALTDDGRRLAIRSGRDGGRASPVRVFDVGIWEELAEIPGSWRKVHSLAFRDEGRVLEVLGPEYRSFELPSGRPRETRWGPAEEEGTWATAAHSLVAPDRGIGLWLRRSSVSAQSGRVHHPQGRLWGLRSGRILGRVPRPEAHLGAVALSADARRIAFGYEAEGRIEVLRVRRGH